MSLREIVDHMKNRKRGDKRPTLTERSRARALARAHERAALDKAAGKAAKKTKPAADDTKVGG